MRLLIKTQTASLQNTLVLVLHNFSILFFFRCNFPFFETVGVFFDSLVVSVDVKKSVAFLGKRCRQQWPIRMQIYAGYNFLETLSIHTLENTRKSEETQL